MKKYFDNLVILTLFAIGAFFAVTHFRSTQDQDSTTTNPAQSYEPLARDPVQDQLDSMTLDQKIAQMLIVERTTPTLSPDELPKLQTAPYGGYILMAEAYSTLAGTRELVHALQSSAQTPLIITTDEEGGSVQRLQSITDQAPTSLPDMYSVGTTTSTDYAKTIGRVLAEELRVIGINVDMAPDADVFSNPDNTVIGRRSFSEDPTLVATMSEALADGLQSHGVTATFKHFPGHGDTDVDSHQELPIINRTREELDHSDLIPFTNAIAHHAKFIMVGHIALPNLTGDTTPATLSPAITTALLRDELGYQNLIITDALNMKALTDNYAETDIYTKAVQAGADLLLMPPNPTLAAETIRTTIPESRIDESVYRILSFKLETLPHYTLLDPSYFGSSEHASALTPAHF